MTQSWAYYLKDDRFYAKSKKVKSKSKEKVTSDVHVSITLDRSIGSILIYVEQKNIEFVYEHPILKVATLYFFVCLKGSSWVEIAS